MAFIVTPDKYIPQALIFMGQHLRASLRLNEFKEIDGDGWKAYIRDSFFLSLHACVSL